MIQSVLTTAVLLSIAGYSTIEALSVKQELLRRVESQKDEGNIYGVIVDCGSSGTRAHIYQWDSAKDYPDLLHDIEPMRDDNGKPVSKKIVPGLSSVEDNPEAASGYIQPIIDFIVEKIPASRIKYTGIYILATAGMRLLEKDTQEHIMFDIAHHLESNYEFAKISTSVISGADEGMYQWISVNAKAKRFLEANTNARAPTYAVVEMGGASIQITYQLRPGMELMLEDWLGGAPEALKAVTSQIVEPQLSREEEDYNFRLVSVTFLGFGGNMAREIFVDVLIKNVVKNWLLNWADKYFGTHFTKPREKVLSLNDPCLPKGATEQMIKPVSILHDTNKTIGFSTDEGEEETFTVELKGSGRYNECKQLVRKVLASAKAEKLYCDPNEPCTMSLIGTNFVPYHRFDFLGVSDLYYTTHNILGLDGEYNHENIAKRTKNVCGTSYKSLLQTYPEANEPDVTRTRLECFKAVWVDTFLTEGINMPKSFKKLKTVAKINGDDLEWTLGAVLDKSLAIEKATSSEFIDE